MSKFKVGDRVYAEGNLSGYKGPSTIVRVDPNSNGFKYLVNFDKRPGSKVWAHDASVRPLEELRKIVITTDGTITLARLYEGKEVAKSATAKCNPIDTFNFNIGAQLAFNRLVYGTDYHPEEVAFKPKDKPEPVKLYCVKDYRNYLKTGKVYEFDGHCVNYDNIQCARFPCFKSWRRGDRGFSACLVPLVRRPAKVGEWVLITNAQTTSDTYKDGEVCLVTEVSDGSGQYVIGTFIKTKSGKTHNCCPRREGEAFVYNSEYLVLDGYHPEPEKPKYYSGKVVCVEVDEKYWWRDEHPKVGRVHEIRDGRFVYADGSTSAQLYTDVPGINEEFVNAKFIELKQ